MLDLHFLHCFSWLYIVGVVVTRCLQLNAFYFKGGRPQRGAMSVAGLAEPFESRPCPVAPRRGIGRPEVAEMHDSPLK